MRIRLGKGLLGLALCGRALAVSPDPQVQGRVLFDTGRPAAGAQVRLFYPADLSRSHGVIADASGRFSLNRPGTAGGRASLPRRTALLQNYPNPFNPSTVIPYQLSSPAPLRLEVFNVLGQRLATLVDQEQPAGLHTAVWHGTDEAGRPVAAGLYFYRLRGSGVSETRRMVLVDGQAGAPGAAPAVATQTGSSGSAPVYVLTVSGPGVATHVDPDFRAGPEPLEIVVEARAGAGSRAKRAAEAGSRILGDVDANGRVDLIDAVLVWLYTFDPTITMPNDGDISLGDVNRDGRIDVTDVYHIATYSVDPADPSLPEGIGDLVAMVLEGKMYWVDRWTSKIQRSNLDGSEVEDLVTTGLEEPTDLALDLEGGRMYWSDRLTGKIQRANLDGSEIEDLVTDTYGIWSLALDLARDRMYWTKASHTGRKIQRAHLDGSGVEDLISTGLFQVAGLALDLAGGKMYWTDYGAKRIQRANLDGSRVEDLVTTGVEGPWGLALDLTQGKMYWADWIRDTIQRANLDGSQVEVLLRRQDNPASLVLVIPEKKMYWVDGGWNDVNDGGIHRASLDGSQVEKYIVGGMYAARGLVLDLPGLPEVSVDRPPVLDGIVKQSVAEGELLRIDLFARDPEGDEVTYEAQSDDPGVATVSVSDRQLTIHPVALGATTVTVTASDAGGNTTRRAFPVKVTEPVPESRGRMYWTDWDTDKIQRANLDGSQVEDLVTSGLDSPSGLALDVSGGKMYWLDAGTDKIQRANLDGSLVEDLVTTGLFSPTSLALDVGGGKMYWPDEGWGWIRRANLDGSQVERLPIFSLHSPAGLALDLSAGKVYWTDTGRSHIARTNLDGSRVEILVTGLHSAIGWLNSPRALALDLTRGKIYWQDSGTLRTQRANLDGSQAEDIHASGLGYPTIGLALDVAGGKIYWTDWGKKEIRRSNLDGTRVEDLVTGLGGPVGLALEILAPDLVAEYPWANPPDPAPGQSFTLSVAIHNRGPLPAPATTIRYYLSTDATIAQDDTEMGTRPVRGLSAPATSFKLIRLRAPWSPGDYYYGACVEPPAGEVETHNNCSPAVKVAVRG